MTTLPLRSRESLVEAHALIRDIYRLYITTGQNGSPFREFLITFGDTLSWVLQNDDNGNKAILVMLDWCRTIKDAADEMERLSSLPTSPTTIRQMAEIQDRLDEACDTLSNKLMSLDLPGAPDDVVEVEIAEAVRITPKPPSGHSRLN